tara:strand:- start:276 stop:836 length:561 start_codon:yes stop_codon:yes gene_type:complete
MAKNEWARDAFRKAQNLMSKGYNDFEPATVITKDELSNLKNTLLGDDQIKQENDASWLNMENNPYNQAAENALAKANDLEAVPKAYNPDDPDIEEFSLEDNLAAAEDDLAGFEDFTFNSLQKWEDTFNTADSPALTAPQAKQGANLATKELDKLKQSLKKAKDESKEKIQDRIDQVTYLKDRLTGS